MTVYHGSNVIVNYPDVEHSFRALDFGKGFYVTTVKEQAERGGRQIFTVQIKQSLLFIICRKT